MTIFYVNNDKSENQEFIDKYDLAKFIDGASDTPEDTKQRIRIVVNKEKTYNV